VMQPLTARDRSRYAVWVLFSLWTWLFGCYPRLPDISASLDSFPLA
jgi:hypothetical protein